MAHSIFTIKKNSTFLIIREKGKYLRGKYINIQILNNQDLKNSIGVGYIASKKIGNAVKRNKAKRIMREAAKKILINGKINSYYVLIAKPSLLEIPFRELSRQLKEQINEKSLAEADNAAVKVGSSNSETTAQPNEQERPQGGDSADKDGKM